MYAQRADAAAAVVVLAAGYSRSASATVASGRRLGESRSCTIRRACARAHAQPWIPRSGRTQLCTASLLATRRHLLLRAPTAAFGAAAPPCAPPLPSATCSVGTLQGTFVGTPAQLPAGWLAHEGSAGMGLLQPPRAFRSVCLFCTLPLGMLCTSAKAVLWSALPHGSAGEAADV